jgi:hypothetical protein
MSERKVINKYIPPNFDPKLIPKNKLPKDRQYVVRLMAPFSMQCDTCKEYIYKGRKFNARKETVSGERYLTFDIYRFYIRCPTCASEITFKTDPEREDYVCEHGAKRNFEPWKEEQRQIEQEKQRRADDESNPIQALETKALDSKKELDALNELEHIRMIQSKRKQIDIDALISKVSPESDHREVKEEKKPIEIVQKYSPKKAESQTRKNAFDLGIIVKKARKE